MIITVTKSLWNNFVYLLMGTSPKYRNLSPMLNTQLLGTYKYYYWWLWIISVFLFYFAFALSVVSMWQDVTEVCVDLTWYSVSITSKVWVSRKQTLYMKKKSLCIYYQILDLITVQSGDHMSWSSVLASLGLDLNQTDRCLINAGRWPLMVLEKLWAWPSCSACVTQLVYIVFCTYLPTVYTYSIYTYRSMDSVSLNSRWSCRSITMLLLWYQYWRVIDCRQLSLGPSVFLRICLNRKQVRFINQKKKKMA